MPVQGYTPADLARLRSVQANAGRTTSRRKETRIGLRVVRIIRQLTDSGALVATREIGDRRDVHVQTPHISGFGTLTRRRA